MTGVIAAGGAVYAATNGAIASTGTVELGKALEASTAASDIIEYVPESDKAVGVSDVNTWISDYVWLSSDNVTNRYGSSTRIAVTSRAVKISAPSRVACIVALRARSAPLTPLGKPR